MSDKRAKTRKVYPPLGEGYYEGLRQRKPYRPGLRRAAERLVMPGVLSLNLVEWTPLSQDILPSLPAVIAANHQSAFLDIAIAAKVGKMTGNHPVFPMKEAFVHDRRVSRLFHALGGVGVDRGAGAEAMVPWLRYMREVVPGRGAAVFAEGTRQKQREVGSNGVPTLARVKHGASNLSLLTGMPVVPVGIIGADGTYRLVYREGEDDSNRRVVHVAQPIDPREYLECAGSPELQPEDLTLEGVHAAASEAMRVRLEQDLQGAMSLALDWHASNGGLLVPDAR